MPEKFDNEYYKKEIKSKLKEKRYNHSLCVADMAKKLAEKYGADAEKAYTAGLLHDIMKEAETDDQLKIIKNSGILLDNIEKKQKKLLHAISGSVYVRDILGLHDNEILMAIRYHTTGRGGMRLLEKILYIADYVSEDRDFEGVERLRELALKDLDEAMLECTRYTINDLMNMNCPVHRDSLDAYNDCVM